MPTTDAPSRPRSELLTVEPQLFTIDMDRSISFFVEQLGFSIVFEYGKPTFYAQVGRDGVKLNLRHVDQPVINGTADEDLLSAAITVSNARELYLEFQGRGVDFNQPLTREPWHDEGHGAFIIADPDGNLLLFAGRTD